MGIPSGWELIVLLVVLVLLFGATKLPAAARSLGQSIRIFKAETKSARSEEREAQPASQRESLPPSGPAAAAAYEPRVEQPRVEEPRVEQPRVEEPRVEEPRVEEPRVEEPRRPNDTIG